jgi:Tetratricopeptide repeat
MTAGKSNLSCHRQGLGQSALVCYRRALPIRREVGDRAGEAVTRYNMAMVYRDAGRLMEAVTELELVVGLQTAVQHPDLEADTAMLEKVRAELLASQGSVSDAHAGEER